MDQIGQPWGLKMVDIWWLAKICNHCMKTHQNASKYHIHCGGMNILKLCFGQQFVSHQQSMTSCQPEVWDSYARQARQWCSKSLDFCFWRQWWSPELGKTGVSKKTVQQKKTWNCVKETHIYCFFMFFFEFQISEMFTTVRGSQCFLLERNSVRSQPLLDLV